MVMARAVTRKELMKKWILCALMLFNWNSLYASSNRVGDSILLSGPFQGGTLAIEASYLSFDGASMLQRQNNYLNGALLSQEDSMVASEDLLTPESAGLIVAICPNIGGVHEYLDLPVGRTLTCKLESNNLQELPLIYSENLQNLGDVLWVGPFPVLGVAKVQIPGTVLTIQNYRWN
jgi:hypothetical protein